ILDVGPTCCVPAVVEGLSKLNVSPERVAYLLTSHIHLDHGGGTAAAMKLMPDAVGIVHPGGVPHLEKPWKLWEASLKTLGDLAEAYGQPEPVPPGRLVPASEGMQIDLGDLQLETLHTPGHAPHHLSFFDRQDSLLFAGELCGVRARGVRRPATPPPLYLDQQLDSIDRAISLQPSVLCYGHFGWESNATSRLKAHRRQLMEWRDIVAAGLGAGCTREQIADEIACTDPKLAGVSRLSPLQQRREMFLVKNAVMGLAGHLERTPTSA
ncbi:MAG: MBL fold metallo-hydrolase, partial [Dehalococcoidia bacterium]|nr:MBL fold metallo-hydrolase [Dehalococcoidia bacterium]